MSRSHLLPVQAMLGAVPLAAPADVIACAEEELLCELTRVGTAPRATSAAPNYDGSGITVTASNEADAEAPTTDALQLNRQMDARDTLMITLPTGEVRCTWRPTGQPHGRGTFHSVTLL